MAIIRLQGKKELEANIYYEFNTATEPLGEGGMGKVFRGRRVSGDGRVCDVAIKFMFDGLPESVIDRARREAAIQIPHENLVEMMGFLATETETPHPHYHVVSELLVGVMLADLLEGVTATKSGEQIPFAQKLYAMYRQGGAEREKFALIVMRNVLSGIMCLHDHDYIHRDIDPTNIMITRDGKIKLIDFGIAKHLNSLATQDKALTSTGQFMGKAQYAAPELVLGDVPNQNKTTDIYELGILFYQLVAGNLPFEGTSHAVLSAQLKTKTPVKLLANPAFGKVIARATEKEPQKRYQSAAEFRVAVEQLESQVGRSVSLLSRLASPVVYGPVAVAVIAILAFLLWPTPAPDEGDISGPEPVEMTELEQVKHQLYSGDKQQAKAGYDRLRKMNKDPEALYLMSRLYYKQLRPGGLTDSVIRMQANLDGVVAQDNKKAHEYLMKVEKLEPKHYKALYEIGLDYLAGPVRTGGEERNVQLSRTYFERSNDAALEAGDTYYAQNYPQTQLSNY